MFVLQKSAFRKGSSRYYNFIVFVYVASLMSCGFTFAQSQSQSPSLTTAPLTKPAPPASSNNNPTSGAIPGQQAPKNSSIPGPAGGPVIASDSATAGGQESDRNEPIIADSPMPKMLSDYLTAKPGDDENNAGATLITYLFDESDQIRPKYFELRALIFNLAEADESKFIASYHRRIEDLDTSLRSIASEHEYWQIGKDALGMFIFDAALSTFGGYGGGIYTAQKAGKYALNKGEGVLAWGSKGKVLLRRSTYADIAERRVAGIRSFFAQRFRKATDEESLFRSLKQTQGLDDDDIATIQRNLVPVGQTTNFTQLQVKPYKATNMRNIRAVAVIDQKNDAPGYGTLIFEQRSAVSSTKGAKIFYESKLPIPELERLKWKIYRGKARFIELIREDGATNLTRVPAGAAGVQLIPASAFTVATNKAGSFLTFLRDGFNGPRAAQIFLFSGAMEASAYTLAYEHLYSPVGNIFLEGLIPYHIPPTIAPVTAPATP